MKRLCVDEFENTLFIPKKEKEDAYIFILSAATAGGFTLPCVGKPPVNTNEVSG